MVRTRGRLASSQIASGFRRHYAGTTKARAYPRQGIRPQAELHGLVHHTRQRAPRAVVHGSNHGLQGRFGEGLTLNEVRATRQNDLEDFAGSFFPRTYQDHGRSARKPTPPLLGDSGNPTTQLLVPGIFAKQGCVHVVSSSRLLGTKSSTGRSLSAPDCKGFSPELLQYVAHRLLRWWQVRFDYIIWETLLEHAQDPDFVVSEWLRDGCPTGIGESIIKANGISHQRQNRLTKSHGSSTKNSSRPSPS